MLVLPKNIGSLTLHRKIGTGTLAESFLATGADGKPAVVRRILPFIAKDPARLAGIEARVGELSGFRHPALVQVTGTVEEGGETFIIEEYVEGVSLERLITAARNQGSSLPANLFLHIAVQICNALEALHSRQGSTGAGSVLHLGIKPGAVFVGPDGKVAVGSYGLTRSPNTLPHGGVTGPVALKMEYLSPEQTHADQQITPASDLFSLGAVLYELLTLESLFRAESNLQTIHRIRRGEVTSQLLRVKGRLPGLDKILYRALSVNPKHRYQRAFVLREDLRGLMSGYSFASVNDDARGWLAPLFDERARTVDIARASMEESARTLLESEESVTGIRPAPTEPPTETLVPPEAPAPRATVTRTLIGLDDDAEVVSGAETTDIGFFPSGDPDQSYPDPTASSSGMPERSAAPQSATPAGGPELQTPRASLRPVSLVNLDDEPDTKIGYAPAAGDTLLPELDGPENTAAWIASPAGHGHETPDRGVETTASHIGGDPEPDNTASWIPPVGGGFGGDHAAADAVPETTAAHIPARESATPEAVTHAEPPPAPPEPVVGLAEPVAAAPPPPQGAATQGFSRPMPGPGLSRPMPGPRTGSIAPVSPPPQTENDWRAPPATLAPSAPETPTDDFAPAPQPRAPLFAMGIAAGLAAIVVCSGVIYQVSQYAVHARAERVAQAMQEAAPPVVAPTDDPAATLAAPPPLAADLAEVAPPTPAVAEAAPPPIEPPTPAPEKTAEMERPAAPVSPPVPPPARSTPQPTAQPVARTSQPVARSPQPVSQPVTRTPVAQQQPVAREPVARAPVSTRSSVPAVAPILPEIDEPLDATVSTLPAVNLDALASDARAGRLRAEDADTLASVQASDPNYTRAQTLLLSNALKKADGAATERALKALLALPENNYNPQILAADALYQINRGQYDRALARAETAERYWSRLPPGQSFATRTQIYEVEAAAWQGKFYNSDGDLTALENAIRGWEKYRDHVATESRTDLQKGAEAQIAKLQDIKERVQ